MVVVKLSGEDKFSLGIEGPLYFGGIRMPKDELNTLRDELRHFIQTADRVETTAHEIDFFDGAITHFYIQILPRRQCRDSAEGS